MRKMSKNKFKMLLVSKINIFWSFIDFNFIIIAALNSYWPKDRTDWPRMSRYVLLLDLTTCKTTYSTQIQWFFHLWGSKGAGYHFCKMKIELTIFYYPDIKNSNPTDLHTQKWMHHRIPIPTTHHTSYFTQIQLSFTYVPLTGAADYLCNKIIEGGVRDSTKIKTNSKFLSKHTRGFFIPRLPHMPYFAQKTNWASFETEEREPDHPNCLYQKLL